MKFVIKKEDFYNGIKIVERATSAKALQPDKMNILIETIGKTHVFTDKIDKSSSVW